MAMPQAQSRDATLSRYEGRGTSQENQSARRPSSPTRLRQLRRYGIAVLSVSLALGTSLLLEHFHFHVPSALLLLFAVAVSSWYAGLGPAALAAILSTISFYWYFIEPVRTIYINRSEIPYFLIFTALVVLLSWFGTVRRRVEADLRRSREALWEQASLLSLTHDAVYVRDMKGVIRYWNRGAEVLYGWPPEHAVGKVAHELLKAVLPLPLEKIEAELLRTDRWEGELKKIKKDGTEVLVASRWSLKRDDRGEPVGILVTSNDITERKRAEEALHRINRELRAISNCNQTLLRATDEQSLTSEICRIVCEEAGYRMAWVGYAQDDDIKSVRIVACAGAGIEDGYIERMVVRWSEDTPWGRGPSGTAIRSGRTCYIQDYSNDARVAPWREDAAQRGYGSVIALPLKDEHDSTFGSFTINSPETNAFSVEEVRMLEELAGDLAFGICVIRARIERERAEKTLALRSFALNSVHETTLLIDEQGHIRDVNEECSRFLGYSREQLLQMRVSELDPEMSAARWPEHWAQLKAEGSLTFERLLRSKDGRIANFEINANYFEYGGTAYNLALARDITVRKQAELQLRNSEQRLGLLIQQSPLGFIGWNSDFRLTEWNPAAEKIFGYTREEVLGRDISFLLPDSARESVNERMREVQTKKVVRRGTNQNLTRDGRIITCDWCNAPLSDQDGRVIGAIALCEDVTTQRKLEEQLRQSQKMEAIGQLAGGVAHDFNNILGVINGYSEVLLSRRKLEEEQRSQIEEILAAGQRAASLTRQLLAFSRKLVLQPKVLNLNFVIEGFEKMLRRLIGEDVEVRTVLDPNLSAVNADPNQMEQVLLNFCINSRDAMPEGGRITIQTSNLELDDAMAAQQFSLTPGRYVTLSVSDTGIGMDQEIQSHIFEPFFTTKGPERGTGLGLATVYGIVKQSGGHVSVYSEPGRGTTFRVYLPAVSQETRADEQISAPQELLQGTETVLLVEDAAPLRTLYHKILEERGYTVLEADDGQRAIEIAEQYAGDIALLLTDVSLPKMNGSTLARILLQQRSTMKVLFMSGHSDDVVSGPDHLLPAGAGFLQKPFTTEELFRRMREMLNPQEPGRAA